MSRTYFKNNIIFSSTNNDLENKADSNHTHSIGNANTAGFTKLYGGTGTRTDGTMTQNAINTALKNISMFKLEKTYPSTVISGSNNKINLSFNKALAYYFLDVTFKYASNNFKICFIVPTYYNKFFNNYTAIPNCNFHISYLPVFKTVSETIDFSIVGQEFPSTEPKQYLTVSTNKASSEVTITSIKQYEIVLPS